MSKFHRRNIWFDSVRMLSLYDHNLSAEHRLKLKSCSLIFQKRFLRTYRLTEAAFSSMNASLQIIFFFAKQRDAIKIINLLFLAFFGATVEWVCDVNEWKERREKSIAWLRFKSHRWTRGSASQNWKLHLHSSRRAYMNSFRIDAWKNL